VLKALQRSRNRNDEADRLKAKEPEAIISPQIPSSVTQAIVNAHYPRVIAEPDSARNRAQASFTIASAIATTLVGFSVLGDFDALSVPVQVLGVLALFTWVATAVFYIIAVAAPVEDAGLKESNTVYEFANAVLGNSLAERKEIDARQKRARWTGAIAVILTLITVFGALFYKSEPESRVVDVVISDRAIQGIQKMCSTPMATLRGSIEEGSLEENLISIKLEPNQCGDGEVTVTFRKEELLGVATR
jgi:hypothetical protein